MNEREPLSLDQLAELVRLVKPSYEEQQLAEHVERECIAADLLAHPWCPEGFTLAQARHVAAHLHDYQKRNPFGLPDIHRSPFR